MVLQRQPEECFIKRGSIRETAGTYKVVQAGFWEIRSTGYLHNQKNFMSSVLTIITQLIFRTRHDNE